jgi:hypothetical protein
LSCGKAIGFGKLPSDIPKPIAYNCGTCFCFSFWSLYRWPCIFSFDGESAGQRAGPLTASHILQILKRLLHQTCSTLIKIRAAAWPFRYRIGAVAFPISRNQNEIYSRLSFLNATTESQAKYHRDRVPEKPKRGCFGPGFANRLALSFGRAVRSGTAGRGRQGGM